jgi:transposase
MQITTVGLDLAKHIFQVHAVDAAGKVAARKRLRRGEVLPFFAGLSRCLIGMEACATSHHWARELAKLGHTVKLMPPAYVKAYVKRGKTDAADAEAICEAVLPPLAKRALAPLVGQLLDLQPRIRALEAELLAWHRQSRESRRLETIPGVGFITATAIAATVANPSYFRSGREFAAWLGLTPRPNSSGGKERLGRISKMGDGYLRTLLVVGATAVIRYARTKTAADSVWVNSLLSRKPVRLVSVALANKTARIAWALMSRGEIYRSSVPASA